MPRIPEEEIERLKKEISLVALVEARGVQLTGSRHNLVGRCCLHDDKTPSLIVDGEKGVWHCFGACQTGGSVIDWIMKAEGVAFRTHAECIRFARHADGIAVGVDCRDGAPEVIGRHVLLVDDVEQKLLRVTPAEFKKDAHHWLILHGRYVCKARKPECARCIVADLCSFKGKTL